MTDAVLDFWFDFASTYSYLTAARIRPLAAKASVRVRFRPFLLGPIFKAQGWDTSPFNIYEAKGRYMWRDMERLAAGLDIPFRRPDPSRSHHSVPAEPAKDAAPVCWRSPVTRDPARRGAGRVDEQARDVTWTAPASCRA